jgi:hypothetical protein
MKYVLVDDPITNDESPADEFIESCPKGDVVPMPTFPLPSTKKRVAEEDPMTNSGTPDPKAFGLTERSPHGVVVPIPSLPKKYDVLVVVESNDPTVSCDDVAISTVPSELDVMMEFGAKDVEFVPPLATGRVPVT